MAIYEVYVPSSNSYLSQAILPASGIVGKDLSNGRVLIHFEGNLYGVQGLKEYHSRVLHAAGRLEAKYPTVAMMHVNKADLIEIGEFDSESSRLTLTMPINEIPAWGVDFSNPLELGERYHALREDRSLSEDIRKGMMTPAVLNYLAKRSRDSKEV